MAELQKSNLLLHFKLDGEPENRVYTAARITIDGKGGLTLHRAGGRGSEWIRMEALEAFSIQTVPCAA